MRLDCPPPCQSSLDDPHVPLWLTEGQRKADALVSHGACALAFLGVWNFRGRNAKGGSTWLPDWQFVALSGREVCVVYDSDVMLKEGVAKALDALVSVLVYKGARVHVAYLPSIAGAKMGADDFLLQHCLADLEALLVAPRQPYTKAQSQPHNGTTPGAIRQLRVTALATVRPERVRWLWKPYLPLGRPVAIEGDAGVGKSTLVAKIIAHLTAGLPFPNVLHGQAPQPVPASNVCVLTAEDDAGDTVLPRVMINGGDPTRVYLIDGWSQPDGAQGMVTMQDLDLLTQVLEQYTPKLIVFDPIQSYFGRRVDMNHASDTRPVLDSVIGLCKIHDCTPLFVRHIGKARRDKALYAGLGSIDITAAMRSVLFLGQDPDQDLRRILAQSKSNNAKLGPSLAYKIVSVEQDLMTPDSDHVTVEAPRLDWDGLSPLTATDLASPPVTTEEETSTLEQAKAFLVELLADGSMLAEEVHKAAKQAGIAMMTIRRAKPLAGVMTRRRHLEDIPSKAWPWEWSLTENEPTRGRVYIPDEHLERLEKLPKKSMACEDISRCSSEHLETEPQHQENQQLALDALDAHQEVFPCAQCGGTQYWQDEYGVELCVVCHPRPRGVSRRA